MKEKQNSNKQLRNRNYIKIKWLVVI